MATILLINPNTSVRTTEMMVTAARPCLPPGMTIRGLGAARGERMIVDEAALAAGAEEVVRIGVAEAGTADAIIVAAFGDPGAARLRALVPIPVIGIGEAAIRAAADSGRRFGIATTTPQLVGSIEALVVGWDWQPVSPVSGSRKATHSCSPRIPATKTMRWHSPQPSASSSTGQRPSLSVAAP